MPRLLTPLLLLLILLTACDGGQPTDRVTRLPTLAPPAADWPLTPADAAPLDPAAPWQTWSRTSFHARTAFAADGALWAATGAGVLRWDLARDAYTRLGPADGLPQPWVSDLVAAADGAIWLVGGEHVTRVDGLALTHFGADDGLTGGELRAVAMVDGAVWVGAEQGLFRLRDGAWEPVPVAGVDHRPVNRLLPGPDGLLWLESPDGIFSYDPAADRWAWPSGEADLAAAEGRPVTPRLLGLDPDGRPWVSVAYGATYRLDGDAWTPVYPSDGARFACDVAFDGPQIVYLATCNDGGLGVLRRTTPDGDWQPAGPPDYFPDVHHVNVSPRGTQVAVTAGRLFVGQADVWRELRAGFGPRQPTALQALPGDELWLAFGDGGWIRSGGGLARLHDGQWRAIPAVDAGGGNLRALALGADGALHAGGTCAVARRAGTDWENLADCDTVFGDVVDLALTPDGTIYAAAQMSLNRYAAGGWETYPDLAHTVAAGPEGRVVALAWTGTQGEYRLLTWDGDGWTARPAPYAARVRFAPDGTLWGLTAAGVAPWTGESWGETALLDPPLGSLTDLVAAPDGTLWIAGERGIGRLVDGRWQSAPTPAALQRITVDDAGVVWGTLLDGLARFLPPWGEGSRED